MNESDLQLAKAIVDSERNSLSGNDGVIKKTAVTRTKDKFDKFRRTRSLNAPSPVQTFGPCGRIMKNSSMVI
ncbi:unnamed protein product [Callosobruchus maculatus]|uniref:Uncharacterized protein n=1 Tax=Callosobruchus maculatus TaxID=64391 RepID=A0A653DPQ3_CALMS|nr:unnamed protein product [Callosobruchus maculatus]